MAWTKVRVTDDGNKRFVACYRDPKGRQRSAGTFSSRHAAERAAHREDAKVRHGAWQDHTRGQVTFAEYVETVWPPAKHVEASTLAAHRSYLDKHFLPLFGRRPKGKILPSGMQRWVTTATENGLASVIERALRDRVITVNPCRGPAYWAFSARAWEARCGRHPCAETSGGRLLVAEATRTGGPLTTRDLAEAGLQCRT
jgi:hypothetical protein